jgi:hypothetical protein
MKHLPSTDRKRLGSPPYLDRQPVEEVCTSTSHRPGQPVSIYPRPWDQPRSARGTIPTLKRKCMLATITSTQARVRVRHLTIAGLDIARQAILKWHGSRTHRRHKLLPPSSLAICAHCWMTPESRMAQNTPPKSTPLSAVVISSTTLSLA